MSPAPFQHVQDKSEEFFREQGTPAVFVWTPPNKPLSKQALFSCGCRKVRALQVVRYLDISSWPEHGAKTVFVPTGATWGVAYKERLWNLPDGVPSLKRNPTYPLDAQKSRTPLLGLREFRVLLGAARLRCKKHQLKWASPLCGTKVQPFQPGVLNVPFCSHSTGTDNGAQLAPGEGNAKETACLFDESLLICWKELFQNIHRRSH